MKKNLVIFNLLLMFSASLIAQNSAYRQKHYNTDKETLALEGYDPVSYFTSEKPLKGNKKWSYTYEGITYWFSNEANKSEFVKNPSKYEPAYGGWCALAMVANGEKVSIDPLTYKISDGRLLLFYKTAFYNALNGWNKDKTLESERLNRGDQYWKSIIKN
ncbi:MAG: YHS domain-containing (seleno)protein [Saprospiraceae bacterium]|nr:YHS domain-containing (seleno)protein [Saprospiraceae bacterium]